METQTDYALEMRGITKEFPGVRALEDVTLRARRGYVHALIGENGAGKSTLMKILDGVYPTGTYRGEILLNGAPVAFRSPQDAKGQGVGFVPQEIRVIEGLSVAENIFVGHLMTGSRVVVRFGELFARAERFLRERNIPLDPRQRVSTLTASQRQLLMLARGLSTEPSVLILDEPTSSLTQEETQNLFRLLRHLRRAGVTSLFITHRLEEIFAIADCVTVLRDGAVAAEFARDAFSQEAIIQAMVGRKIDSLYPVNEADIGAEALRVEGLTVPHPRLAGRNVLENVHFTVHRGEILGIAGLMGSGRSEVLNAIYGRMPHRGKIYVQGVPARIRRPADARKHAIGLLTEERQQDGLLFNFAVRENITLNSLDSVSRFAILDRSRETQAAEAYMRRLSIRAPSLATLVANLSGGNQQKTLLARALMAQPQILLLDEPTKGVDVGAKHEIYRVMMELARQGIAQVVVSSELPELLGLCDRCIVLAGGRVVDAFAKADASEHRVMRAATGGQGPF
jgi:ribose transport system ATP-binding protein/D-xylose transport system ATP-binding protein